MTDVFDEIEDDLRREKLKEFWKENGSWIIGGALAAVVMTGALSFWRQWDYRHDTAATAELVRLVAQPDLSRLEDFAASGSKNHAMIAKFMSAAAHLEKKEKDKAVALYDEISGSSGVDKAYRDLARVLSISQRLDKDDPAKLQQELSGLSGEKAIWRYTALELEALLAFRQGHAQAAVEALGRITADPLAPPEARTRAFALRELYLAEKTGSKN